MGKINIEVNSTLLERLNINVSGIRVQLPVILLFKNGVEEKRYPPVDKKGKTQSVKYYSKKEMIKFFDLENLYLQSLEAKR